MLGTAASTQMKVGAPDVSNISVLLRSRELGQYRRDRLLSHPTVVKRVDKAANNIHSTTQTLRRSVEANSWRDIERVVGDVLINLSEANLDPSYSPAPGNKKEHRELFVLFGGTQALLSLFEKHVPRGDVRHLPRLSLNQTETWNEVLVVLRDLLMSTPSIADLYFSDKFIAMLMTFLSVKNVFDNTMNLLEEVLASREACFPLSLVPQFYKLVSGFSSRQLAHFCRVLSLLVFEQEDRNLMDSMLAPRSFDVLRLRRRRMLGGNIFVIERNQNLIVEMPELLRRMVQILRVINYGPSLHEMLSHNVISHLPISSDILTFNNTRLGVSDWVHFDSLIDSVQLYNNSNKNSDDSAAAVQPRSGASPPSVISRATMPASLDAEVNPDLLSAFSMQLGVGGDSPIGGFARSSELLAVISILQAAQTLGIARLTSLGEAFVQAQTMFANIESSERSVSIRPYRYADDVPEHFKAARRARDELQFNAMLLIPHQIELIFVLCTILAGRRKIHIQHQLHACGLADVLLKMFDRMSWFAPPYEGVNTMEHIHGPNCECNPESAIRIQYLRLVHNYYDRDFLGNINKFSMLSEREQGICASLSSPDMAALLAQTGKPVDHIVQAPCEGLFSRIVKVFVEQPGGSDLTYRFWLSACVENFLRGTGRAMRYLYMYNPTQKVPSAAGQPADYSCAETPLLPFIVKYLQQSAPEADYVLPQGSILERLSQQFDNVPRPASSKKANGGSNAMQTSFDLLGEIVKANPLGLQSLEQQFSDATFLQFVNLIMNNLVDSNVFLRSLWLNVEVLQRADLIVSAHAQLQVSDLASRDSADAPNMSDALAVPFVACANLVDPQTILTGRVSPLATSDHAFDAFACFQFLDNTLYPLPTLPLHPQSHFLTHSWMLYHLGTFSRTARDMADRGTNVHIFRDFERKNVTEALQRRSKTSTEGIVDAIGGAIRKATTHFLRFGDTALTPDGMPLVAGVPKARSETTVTIADILVALEVDERVENSSELELADSPPLAVEQVVVPHVATGSASVSSFTERVPLLSAFVQQQKSQILVRLMSVVTLASINHENICCVNTTLLILLLDHARGALAQTLAQTRALADSISPVVVASEVCGACAPAGNVADVTDPSASLLGGGLVFQNFRELLWYWREYYLRRGRDRLSVEFSCHIPFPRWNQVVDLLCADDGSATALVGAAVPLPVSPYHFRAQLHGVCPARRG